MVFSSENVDLAQAFEGLATDFVALTSLVRKLLYTNVDLTEEINPLKAQIVQLSTKYEGALGQLNKGNDLVSQFRTNLSALSEEVAAATSATEQPNEPIPEVPPSSEVPPVVEPSPISPSVEEPIS